MLVNIMNQTLSFIRLDMVADFILMFDNACKYNEPDSLIYKVRTWWLTLFLCLIMLVNIMSQTHSFIR